MRISPLFGRIENAPGSAGNTHRRLTRSLDYSKEKAMTDGIRFCGAPDCKKTTPRRRRYCSMHRSRIERYGSLNGRAVRPTVAERFWPKVDTSGTCWLWTAGKQSAGYGVVSIGGSMVLAHRWAYEEAHGPIPDGLVIDHLCFTPLCVRPDHLRAVSNKTNSERRAGLNANNTSGHRGVSALPDGRWQVHIMHHRESTFLGYFATKAEAASAYSAASAQLFAPRVEVLV